MKQTPLNRKSKCLKCGLITEMAISFEKNIPNPGDLSVCSGCSVVTKYNDAFELVPLTPRELDYLKENKPLWAQISIMVDVVTRTREHLKNKKNVNKSS